MRRETLEQFGVIAERAISDHAPGAPAPQPAASERVRVIGKLLTVEQADEGGPGSDTVSRKREKRAIAARARVRAIRDRRRFKTTPVPTGVTKEAAGDATGTLHPKTVRTPSAESNVLIDGVSNSKIGGDVLIGRLKGARIFTLTLEERATCPRSCAHWRSCYGNCMGHVSIKRWRHGPELEAVLRRQVPALLREHGRILVRLHVLGDFYSAEYVTLWADLLGAYDDLNVFGFTGWPEATELGGMIAAVRDRYGLRFAIRHSGSSGPWGSFTIDWPTERPRYGDCIVCPEQVDALAGGEKQTHCGSCALCWHTDRSIIFVEHGK